MYALLARRKESVYSWLTLGHSVLECLELGEIAPNVVQQLKETLCMNATENPITVKYFTKAQLMLCNNAAICQRREQSIDKHSIAQVSDDTLLPVSEHYATDDCVRATVVLDAYGNEVAIDLTYNEWDALPTKVIAAATK